jgi:hypothetical protein
LGEFLGIFYAYFEHFECIYMRIFLGFSCAYIPFFTHKEEIGLPIVTIQTAYKCAMCMGMDRLLTKE